MAGSGNAHLRGPDDTVLRVENLFVEFPVGRTGLKVHAVSDVSFDVKKGETLGLVGESGCGKSTTGKAIMQIQRPTAGEVRFGDKRLDELSGASLRAVRPDLQMIFQDPISSLNPRRRVGDIVGEPLKIWASEQNPPSAPVRTAVAILRLVAAIAAGGFALFALFWLVNGFYPYLANNDFSIFRPFYEWLLAQVGALALSAIVVGGASFVLSRAVRDRQAWALRGVMGLAVVIIASALLGIGTLSVLAQGVTVSAAVDETTFEVPDDEALPVATDGTTKVVSDIDVDGSEVAVSVAVNGVPALVNGAPPAEAAPPAEWGPGAALQWAAIGLAAALAVAPVALLVSPAARRDFESMATLRDEHRELVRTTLANVGLDPDTALNRRPHQFSGGQCQRICVARALVLDPSMIICDEPVSALDVSVQAQILNLLEDMKARYDLTMVFIAHDLAVVKNVSDRVAVMYLGKICEVANPDDLYANPAHPYTAALLASIPEPDPSAHVTAEPALGGELPSPVSPPSGCRFRTRCPRAEDRCAQSEPKMQKVAFGHYVACHFPLEAVSAKPRAKASTAGG
jgi:oligopeptide/dipeptide ABC transporter ATP-binding protein